MRLEPEQLKKFVMTVMRQARTTEFLPELKPEIVVSNWLALTERGVGFAYGIEDAGEPIGFLLAIHSEDLFSGKRKACEFLFEVSPEKRTPARAEALLKEFEDGARADGCASVVVGCHSAHKPDVLSRWYRRQGFSFLSAAFERSV